MRTRNFTKREVIHSVETLNNELSEIATCMMGQAQMIRDNLCWYFKREVSMQITSGYRSSRHNRELYDRGDYNTTASSRAKNSSNHVYRLQIEPDGGMYIRGAFDFVPYDAKKNTPLKPRDVFLALVWLRGEFYWKKTTTPNIFHFAQQSNNIKMHWVTTPSGDIDRETYLKTYKD